MAEQSVFVVVNHDGVGGDADAMVYDSLKATQIGVIGGIDKVLKEDPDFWPKERQQEYDGLKRLHKWQEAIALFKRKDGLMEIMILKRKIQSLDEETMAFVLGSAQKS